MMRLIVLIMFLNFSYLTFGQGNDPGNWDLGLNFLVSWPQSDFKSETNDSGLGFEGSVAYQPKKMPVSLGLSLGYLNLGNGGSTENSTSRSTGKLLDISQVQTSYNSFHSNLFLKVYSDQGLMEPYFEILCGYQKLDIETIVDFSNQDQASFRGKLDHASLNFGIGGGVSYYLFKTQTRKNAIQLQLGVRYTMGNDFDFLDPNSLTYSNNQYSYLIQQKNVSLFLFKAGLHFIF